MPEVPWTDLEESSSRAHLIVGVVPADAQAATPFELDLRVALLSRLARHLKLRGIYAIASREGIAREVHLVLQEAEDAATLAEALKAGESGEHPVYASRRTFRCDNPAAAAIEARLREETAVARGDGNRRKDQ
jgi:hypothetical protein